MGAAGYLRRSVSRDPEKEISREAQEASVQRMAAAYGTPAPDIYVDWGISGAKANRPQYLALKEAIAAGAVDTLFAYSLSRLGRNARELLAFFDLCQEHGVRVVTEAEGQIGAGSAFQKFTLEIMAAVAELEREQGVERSTSAIVARRQRGDHVGGIPYGFRLVNRRLVPDPERDPEVVLAAFEEAGSFLGAAKLLNQRHVPTRNGNGRRWWAGGVKDVVQRVAPERVPMGRRAGAPASGTSTLAGLLRCSCGRILTPHRNRQYTHYFCLDAARDTGHPRPYHVSERQVLPWVEAEVAHLRTPETVQEAADVDGRRAELRGQRERLLLDFVKRGLGQEAVEAALHQLDADEAKLDAETRILPVQEVDFTWPPEELNAVLRALFAWIELGRGMVPKRAEWRVPQWRIA